MSDTPETDENMRTWDRSNRPGCDADFARRLERERDELKARVAGLEEGIKRIAFEYPGPTCEKHNSRMEFRGYCGVNYEDGTAGEDWRCAMCEDERIKQQLADERANSDRLAEALKSLRNGILHFVKSCGLPGGASVVTKCPAAETAVAAHEALRKQTP